MINVCLYCVYAWYTYQKHLKFSSFCYLNSHILAHILRHPYQLLHLLLYHSDLDTTHDDDAEYDDVDRTLDSDIDADELALSEHSPGKWILVEESCMFKLGLVLQTCSFICQGT